MADWIVVVDDDPGNLKIAGFILGKHQKRVTLLSSGYELLEFVKENEPDIILLDINMPKMDGFETLQSLREYEKENQKDEIPVIFLTAETESATESRGFAMGVSDYIKKPFDPDILVKRIDNIIENREKYLRVQEEATKDPLTGLINKTSVNDKMEEVLKKSTGCFMMIDLDSFKLVNDLYGHEMGDRVLIAFAEILRQNLDPESIIGRIGGDEFVAFSPVFDEENQVRKFTADLNDDLTEEAKRLMGPNMEIPLGVSVGAMFVPKPGDDFAEIFRNADKALYRTKENGKHGYSVFSYEDYESAGDDHVMNLKSLSMILAERNISNNALRLEMDSFINVYRFVTRYIMRYHKNACKLLFTLSPAGEMDGEAFDEACEQFCKHAGDNLRKSDLVMQYRKNQVFIFLTDIREDAVSQVIGNIISTWKQKNGESIIITHEVELMESDSYNSETEENPWVVVVDDDVINLKLAGHILSKNYIHVTAVKSGRALLEFLKDNRPNLILLDVSMPEMDGYETLQKIKTMEEEVSGIPVVFLTANDDEESEKRGLALGAVDFVRKPIVPEVLVMRVKRIMEMIRLQKNLAKEVEKKTKENEELFIDVVRSLAGAIDAKDPYTNGHSERVALYSRKIAKRFGYPAERQSDIYMMGLLHDVGKIGISDVIINLNRPLTTDEFREIKKHPVIGAQILQNIKKMPELATGARWHHEQFDGSGYPDGLKGEEIPEAARIIAVADAYDAMTSYRSYRDAMSQADVRAEILRCSGTQFDPVFAEIMVQMIDEDKNYSMRELQKKSPEQK